MIIPRCIGVVLALSLLAALVSPAALAQEAETPTDAHPLAFFEPYMGVWLPHPDWEPLKTNPSLHTLLPLNFEWETTGRAIRMAEGLRLKDEMMTTGLIVWNPATARAEFLAYQAGDDLVFEGTYEALGSDTLRRIYDVIYPDGQSRTYRETFVLLSSDLLDWTTELLTEGEWIKRRQGGVEFQAIRASSEPAEALLVLERLIGEWGPDPARIPERMQRWREEQGVMDGYTSFQWGTGRRWIAFGDHRQTAEGWRQEGAGLIAWHPQRRTLVYREHSEAGVALEGAVVVVDALTIQRHYRAFAPDGTAQRWVDTWRWEDEAASCFEWTTKRVVGREETSWPPYWVCKR